MQSYILRALVIMMVVGLCHTAAAAPFCLEARGLTPQCIYYDAAECRKRSFQLAGVCTANLNELTLPAGTGVFCLVNSNRVTQCIYRDRASCENVAGKMNAVCIDNATVGTQPDPYRQDPNRRY